MYYIRYHGTNQQRTCYYQYPWIGLLGLLLLTSVSFKLTQATDYYESLAKHRRTFKLDKSIVSKPIIRRIKKLVHTVPKHDITGQLDYVLACKKERCLQNKHMYGYTVQVYMGGNREEALKIKNKLYMAYPSIAPEVYYNVPNYTVRLGKFLNKLEAYLVYATIRRRAPKAIIRPATFENVSDTLTSSNSIPTSLIPN